jgi:hypothetical protein
MRWKLLKRRFSISAPRVIVRSHLPWPLRWVVIALALGFSAAFALWAFEFGRELSGLEGGSRKELVTLREELARIKTAHQDSQAVANSADTMLKAERVTQESLAARVKMLEKQNADLARDLAFFEKLMPARGDGKGLSVRGLQAGVERPGKLQYQLLLMQPQTAKSVGEFKGRYELSLTGILDGKPWAMPIAGGPRTLSLRQYQRLEGMIDYPPLAVVKQLAVKVVDAAGVVQATESTRL